jgi:hypothetical protein
MQKLVDLIDKATQAGVYNLQEVVEADAIFKQIAVALNELNDIKKNAKDSDQNTASSKTLGKKVEKSK